MQQKDNKYIFGVCRVGEKGQIVIPKQARDVFQISAGDSLLLVGDKEKGLALIKTEVFSSITEEVFKND